MRFPFIFQGYPAVVLSQLHIAMLTSCNGISAICLKPDYFRTYFKELINLAMQLLKLNDRSWHPPLRGNTNSE